MNVDRWRQIEALCHAALACAETERAAFLESACAGDETLKRDVESLLAQAGSAAAFLDVQTLAVTQETVSKPPAALLPGQRLGVYELQGPLGKGGMGVVYRALDTNLNRPVAIKFLSEELAGSAACRRFQREAKTASSLNHPHILTVHDAGEFEGRQYLVTELVDGGTLKDWALGAKRGWRETVELLIGVADGLAAAHQAGILHRDIKPENILISKSGYAKLADFGLAKVFEDAASLTITDLQTQPGAIVGTIAYMSPEQALGQAVDIRSDVFSFGIVLYETLAGRRPFSGASSVEVLQAIIHRPAAPLHEDVPLALRIVVEKSLEKDAANRFQSMREIVVDLRRLVWQSADAPQGRAAAPSASRVRTVVTAAVLAMVIAGSAATWVGLRRALSSRPTPVQITRFATAVRDPAFSPDGRMLAYVVQDPRGIDSQIFVQLVSGGGPQQLTRTPGRKAWPAFSRDGSQVAFTVTGEEWKWDTWVVPVIGGDAPRLLLPNAHELQWLHDGRVLFSEFKRGIQVGVVVASEGRSDARDVYVPPLNGMAHVSDLSPDGDRVAIGQMRMTGNSADPAPLSCFVLPFVGPGEPRPIGTADVPCSMFVRWSRDGRWLYFASGRAPEFQLFRQPAAGGQPEQLTFDRRLAGVGVVTWFALTGDGRSVVYPSGEAQETVWLQRSGENETQITLEGNARDPKTSVDGAHLFYVSGPRFGPGQMWMRPLNGSSAAQLAPDFQAVSLAPSPDGKFIVFAAPDAHQRIHLWLAPVDRSSAPREIEVGDHEVGELLVSPDNATIFYVAQEGAIAQIWRVGIDGRNRQPITEREPSMRLSSISPDGRWISVTRGARTPREEWIYSVDGGAGRMLFSNWRFRWMPGNRSFLLINSGMVSTAWLVPNPTQSQVPSNIGASPTGEVLARLGATKVLAADFFVEPFPGPDPFSVVYSKVENRSNLFQLALPK